jgi:hypothetical protein
MLRAKRHDSGSARAANHLELDPYNSAMEMKALARFRTRRVILQQPQVPYRMNSAVADENHDGNLDLPVFVQYHAVLVGPALHSGHISGHIA